MMKAEIGVKYLQATECQRLPANHQKVGERPATDPPSQPSKEPTLLTPWFQTSGLRTCEKTHFCFLSGPIGGALLQQP